MLLRNKFNQLVEEINEAYKVISRHIESVRTETRELTDSHNLLADDFISLRDEIATNGVVRDLRKLEKRYDALENALQGLHGLVEDKFNELNSNGVATAINKLNEEVFSERKEKKNFTHGYDFSRLAQMFYGGEPLKKDEEPTLLGKVDAIIAHLGLDVNVAPEEVKEAQVVAKKKPAPKKKGRR